MSEVCDPIAVEEVDILVSIYPVLAFVQNCQIVIMHDGEDPFLLVGP